MQEFVRITGMQDRRLEATSPKPVESVQPPETRGQAYIRLMRFAVGHKIVLERQWGDTSSDDKQQAGEGMATVRDEFRRTFLGRENTNLDVLRQQAFDAIVDMHVARHYKREEEVRENALLAKQVADAIRQKKEGMSGDWPLIRKEFPGQFDEPDYDAQAEMGDPPPYTLHFRENTKRNYPQQTAI